MSTLFRNSYLNPQGKGIIRTKDHKLGLISDPCHLFWKYDDAVTGDTDHALYCTVTIIQEEGSPTNPRIYVVVGDLKTLNINDLFLTTDKLDTALYSQIRRYPRKISLRRLNNGPSRLMTFWLFGKKISLEVEFPQENFLAEVAGDQSGHVWVDGEDRGIWLS